MARTATSFNRRKFSLKPEPIVLVICEDTKSGKRYLEDARDYFRVRVEIEITHCGKTDPKGIVEKAISRQKDFDRVFCAIDRDTHKNFDEALNLAHTSKKVEVIASYPCFEFWLLLHFRNSRKPYTAVGKYSAADLVIKDLRTYPCMKDYDKGQDQNIFKLMLENGFTKARQIAPKVLDEAIASGEMNPSTQLWMNLKNYLNLSLLNNIHEYY